MCNMIESILRDMTAYFVIWDTNYKQLGNEQSKMVGHTCTSVHVNIKKSKSVIGMQWNWGLCSLAMHKLSKLSTYVHVITCFIFI